MLIPLVILAQSLAAAAPAPGGASVYVGRQSQLEVRMTRVEADVQIDGSLNEPVWQRAALLTGFSQFSPQDGVPAADSTQVLVWYSPTAIYFGIRAFESHGAPTATLADRDKIASDDNVQILLDTFNDGRQALMFGVNPFGVQTDGMLVESNQLRTGSFTSQIQSRDQADLSQDYVFQSKGRVTEFGYQVEIRIPFKSLKYQSQAVQTWRLNVVRQVQHSKFEDTWTPARRGALSFLAQSGRLDGLTDLRRGVVLDVNPELTQRVSQQHSTVADLGSRWITRRADPEPGGNVRWGISNNLTLNGTVNPDFSQVESDAGQVTFDPRSAIQFPEKRPFFLDGMEGFTTPSNLVYTRSIQQPVFATKLTGKVGSTTLAVLSAADDRVYSRGFDRTVGQRGQMPLFNIARLQRDIGGQSRIGVTYTDKFDEGYNSHLLDVDGRLLWSKVYSVVFQGAMSHTTIDDSTATAPLWNASVNRNGKRFGFRYAVSGMDPDFTPNAGFISRPGVSHTTMDHRFSWFGAPQAFLQSFTFNPFYDNTWKYDYLLTHRDAIEKKLHFNTQFQLRGGWSGGASVLLETFGYDPDIYRGVYVQRAPNDFAPFTGTPRLPNRDWVVSLNTPQWTIFSANALYLWGQDENFDEWASSDIVYMQLGALIRPTEKLRINPTHVLQSYDRQSSKELVRVERITRVRTEYQVSRPVFVRVVGEYRTSNRLALRDESRTFLPLVACPLGPPQCTPLGARRANQFRFEWLFSYQPNPGTVFFAGYGTTSTPDALNLSQLRDYDYRRNAAYFVKLSYLFRM
jgi:Domain of unknown function (DUF5916)